VSPIDKAATCAGSDTAYLRRPRLNNLYNTLSHGHLEQACPRRRPCERESAEGKAQKPWARERERAGLTGQRTWQVSFFMFLSPITIRKSPCEHVIIADKLSGFIHCGPDTDGSPSPTSVKSVCSGGRDGVWQRDLKRKSRPKASPSKTHQRQPLKISALFSTQSYKSGRLTQTTQQAATKASSIDQGRQFDLR